MNRIVTLPGTVLGTEKDGWQRVSNPEAPAEVTTFLHQGRQLVALRSRDMERWHLSVSHRSRIPTWGELGFARDCLLPPDVWMMVAHPPREFWINYDSRVLHLWEFRDRELIEQFKFEGEQAQRTGNGRPDDGGL